MSIPVVDIFAGPGGLGEGFSSVYDDDGERIFKTVLSIEMEKFAHQTLTLRSFYRQFKHGEAPKEYYQVLRGEISDTELYSLEKFKKETEAARHEAKLAKLGFDKDSVKPDLVDEWIKDALKEEKNWILTGGPPCQAYSVVGRSRRQQTVLNAETDERVDLYKQYLRIIEAHRPAVFIMENVKGMLSARSKSNSIFEKIIGDLKKPGYRIFSLVKEPRNNLFDEPEFEPEDFIIRSEEYGIPQARHRVILLGIRDDFYNNPPERLEKKDPVPIQEVIDDLPNLRSGLSKQKNNWENWNKKVKEITLNGVMASIDKDVANEIIKTIDNLSEPQNGSGNEFVKARANARKINYEPEWFHDEKIGGAPNHESRGHMGSDLHRYLFVSSYGKVKKSSPKLGDFPKELLPAHKNVQESIKTKKFADRFRVQLADIPAKTITSHISKDGHYYIHYDPNQCRSLTVREAARIQTFPDNYYFCGPRTSQYIQVGNAVPPLLAKQIAKNISDLF
ncbi:MAG: DNA cytosine methyltransferase [Balneolaceae bacterium]